MYACYRVCMLLFFFFKFTNKMRLAFNNLLAPDFLILAHPVYKMLIIREPNTLEL